MSSGGARASRERPSNRRGRLSYLAVVAFAAIYLAVGFVQPLPFWVLLLYVGASLVCFVLYAIDKAAAVARRRRIRESTLLLLGLVGGWPGAIVAQQWLRHKTQKVSFRRAFWVSAAVNVGIFVALGTGWLNEWISQH